MTNIFPVLYILLSLFYNTTFDPHSGTVRDPPHPSTPFMVSEPPGAPVFQGEGGPSGCRAQSPDISGESVWSGARFQWAAAEMGEIKSLR